MSKLSAHDIRRIAVEAQRDPRTVRRVFEGKPTKDMAKRAVLEAAAKLGISMEQAA